MCTFSCGTVGGGDCTCAVWRSKAQIAAVCAVFRATVGEKLGVTDVTDSGVLVLVAVQMYRISLICKCTVSVWYANVPYQFDMQMYRISLICKCTVSV